MLRASIEGVDLTLKLLGRLKKNATKSVPEVLDQMAGIILNKALVYVPVATGALRASGRKEVTGRGVHARMTVSFGRLPGGGSLSYALYVHENPVMYHTPPTSYKFLARASRETRGTRTAMVKRLLGMIISGV